MPGVTYYVALPFDVAGGSVVVGEPIEFPNAAAAAIGRAEAMCARARTSPPRAIGLS
jgi:hypothetical protein